MLAAIPAVVADGPLTVNCMAGPGLTVIELNPAMEAFTVSATETDWLPAVFRVTANVFDPLVSVESAGKTAWLSALVKWTIPVYVLATAPFAPTAVTVTCTAVPALVIKEDVIFS